MRTRVMLELGCNHQGSVDLARRMIDDAQRLGVFGVKFQKRYPDSIPEETKRLPRNPKDSFGDTYYTHRKALEFDVDQVAALKRHAEYRGLAFAESVFDPHSLKDVLDVGVRYVKLPSQFFGCEILSGQLVSWRDLRHDLFIMQSTGMHTTREVVTSPWLKSFDVTLYCRSIYPHDVAQADLGSARTIFGALGDPDRCGYSSHDRDGTLIPWLVVMGASWVERHYTLDKAMKGSDHHTVSSDFAEMRGILDRIEEVEGMLECRNVDSLVDVQERANREFYMGGR